MFLKLQGKIPLFCHLYSRTCIQMYSKRICIRPPTAGHKLFAGSSKVLAHEFDDTVGDDLPIEQPVPFRGQDETEMVEPTNIEIQDQSTAQITEIEDDEGAHEEEEVVIQKKWFHGTKIYLHRSLEKHGRSKFRKDLQDCIKNFDGIIVTNLGLFSNDNSDLWYGM